MEFIEYKHSGIEIQGYSNGGIATSIILPNLDLVFDMGNTNSAQIKFGNLLVTHAHLDHFSGVPYFISQRSLQKLPPPNIYVPQEIHSQVTELLKIYSKLEDFEYKPNLVAFSPGMVVELNRQFSFSAFPTYHRVPSLGYTVYESKNKLREEYRNFSQNEILNAKKEGYEISEINSSPIFSYSGDTKIEYVLNHDDVRKSKILFLECTYIDDKKDILKAREWGHTHLFEIAENAQAFENEKLVLIHFSPRYSYNYIKEQVSKILPKSLLDRVHLFLPNKKKSK